MSVLSLEESFSFCNVGPREAGPLSPTSPLAKELFGFFCHVFLHEGMHSEMLPFLRDLMPYWYMKPIGMVNHSEALVSNLQGLIPEEVRGIVLQFASDFIRDYHGADNILCPALIRQSRQLKNQILFPNLVIASITVFYGTDAEQICAILGFGIKDKPSFWRRAAQAHARTKVTKLSLPDIGEDW